VYAGVAGVLAAVGIVAAVFAKSAMSTASGAPPKAEHAETRAPTPPPPPVAAPTTAPAPPPAPTVVVRHVLFASEPLDSHVFQNGQDLGSQPLTVDVPAGEKVMVEVRRDGYRPQKVTLDGTDAKVKVRLVRIPGRPIARPTNTEPRATPPAAPAAPIGGGDIVNPWAK
jgi:hypothetical protein